MVNVLVALLVPWAAAFLLVRSIFSLRSGVTALATGVGFFLAVLLITLSMRVFSALGIPFAFHSLLGVQIVILVLVLGTNRALKGQW